MGGDTRLQQLAKTDRNPVQETEYQNLLKQQGGTSGSSTGNVNDFLNSSQQNQTNMFNQGKSDITDFLGRFSSAVQGGPNGAPSLGTKINDQFGVVPLSNAAGALNDRIQSLKTNDTNQGAGGYASAGQVDQAVNTNYMPQYLRATEAAQRAEGLASNEYNRQIQPFQTEASMLSDRLARESTGFSQQQQNELDVLLKQMDQGFATSQADKDRASQLAVQEQQYQQAIQVQQLKNEALKSIGKNGVYDPVTGEVVAQGSTAAPKGKWN